MIAPATEAETLALGFRTTKGWDPIADGDDDIAHNAQVAAGYINSLTTALARKAEAKLRPATGSPIALSRDTPVGTLLGYRVTAPTTIQGVPLDPGVYIWERTAEGWVYYSITAGTPVGLGIVIPGGIADTFTGDAGRAPAGWSGRWATSTAAPTETADGYLQIARSTAARYALVPDALGAVTGDVDALIKLRWPAGAPKGAFGYGIVLGGSGSPGAESGLYAYLNSNTTDSTITLGKYSAGASTVLGAASAVGAFGPAGTTDTPGPWGFLRLNVTSGTARIRAWAAGSTEPTAWAVSGAAPALNGWAGIFGSTAVAGHIDYVSIVTGGAAAPRE